MSSFVGNAFSLNMVSGDAVLQVAEVSPAAVPQDAISCVGHESTAVVVSELLGREVPMQRVAVSLKKGDTIYVVTLFDADGKPFRAPEGVILGQTELSALRLTVRSVTVA